MPERLDRVTIALNGGNVVITRASREALLQRLLDVHESRQIRLAFTAADGSHPVELSPAQRVELIVNLNDWLETMPEDLLEFRNALIADLRDAGQ